MSGSLRIAVSYFFGRVYTEHYIQSFVGAHVVSDTKMHVWETMLSWLLFHSYLYM